jgi:hypothetical protein
VHPAGETSHSCQNFFVTNDLINRFIERQTGDLISSGRNKTNHIRFDDAIDRTARK